VPSPRFKLEKEKEDGEHKGGGRKREQELTQNFPQQKLSLLTANHRHKPSRMNRVTIRRGKKGGGGERSTPGRQYISQQQREGEKGFFNSFIDGGSTINRQGDTWVSDTVKRGGGRFY